MIFDLNGRSGITVDEDELRRTFVSLCEDSDLDELERFWRASSDDERSAMFFAAVEELQLDRIEPSTFAVAFPG
jgi:hypothetical protein